MRFVVTGSLGNISKPLTKELIQNGHSVTVISSSEARRDAIEALGAQAAIGTVEDLPFLSSTFAGADAVYCMLPPPNFWVPGFNLYTAVETIAGNYKEAVEQSGVKRLVQLSSVGAHTDAGNGLIAMHYKAEKNLGELPSDVAITCVRPVGFFQNLLGFQSTIKALGMMASNYGADDLIPWVSTADIASTVAEKLQVPLAGREACYVASEELTCQQVATILGNAIGKPDLRWLLIDGHQVQQAVLEAGMPPDIAAGLVEMHAAMHSGKLFEDYYAHRPQFGKVKLSAFAADFADSFSK